MTLHEMWKKMEPYTTKLRQWWLSLDKETLIDSQAFTIAFMREVEFFMNRDDCDDYNDDVEGLDEVDPGYFFDEIHCTPLDDDHAAEIFIADCGTGYEYFTGLVNQIIRDWKESHGKAEDKAED